VNDSERHVAMSRYICSATSLHVVHYRSLSLATRSAAVVEILFKVPSSAESSVQLRLLPKIGMKATWMRGPYPDPGTLGPDQEWA